MLWHAWAFISVLHARVSLLFYIMYLLLLINISGGKYSNSDLTCFNLLVLYEHFSCSLQLRTPLLCIRATLFLHYLFFFIFFICHLYYLSWIHKSTQHNITSNKSVIDDPLSPFFLRHSDNPGLVLVTQPLTGDN